MKKYIAYEYHKDEILRILGIPGTAIIEASGDRVLVRVVDSSDGQIEKAVDELVNGPKETLAKGPVKGRALTPQEAKFAGTG